MAVVAALNRGLVGIADALRRAVSIRMAVQTARMSEYLSRFDEESRGARGGVGDAGKGVGSAKRAGLVRP